MKSLKKGRIRARYEGPYQPADVESLMKLVDWVAVPSIWWENAPTVIIEAMSAQRPVIVGDVGGMREMIDTYGSGIKVPIGSIPHWTSVLAQLSSSDNQYSIGIQNTSVGYPPSVRKSATVHMELYKDQAQLSVPKTTGIPPSGGSGE
jgi:hypothetical protein